MSQYKTPGVKVKEVSLLPPSVAQVATSVPAFIGYTKNHPSTTPTRITSMAEYISTFGGPEADLTVTVTAGSGGALPTASAGTPAIEYYMYYSIQLYFLNGGGQCYIVSVGASSTSAITGTTALQAGLTEIKKVDEPTLLLFPDAVSLSVGQNKTLLDLALQQCKDLQDRFVIMDAMQTASGVSADVTDFRDNGIGTNYLDYGAAYYPYLKSSFSFPDDAVKIDYSADANLNTKTLATVRADAETSDSVAQSLNQTVGAITGAVSTVSIEIPPSGAIAGIYCSVDRNRGVWKAPANVSITGVTGPTVKITDNEQADMNVHTSGKSVNAIRTFAGKGTLVWGARTLAGNNNEWRYVPVRRLYITAEESIKKSTQWVVFEPNDAATWAKVKGMIENYLNGLWRQGALAGAKPEDAYFVNVGLGSTMTAQDILAGNLIVEIGMAAVRPAEFIILRFSHKLQES